MLINFTVFVTPKVPSSLEYLVIGTIDNATNTVFMQSLQNGVTFKINEYFNVLLLLVGSRGRGSLEWNTESLWSLVWILSRMVIFHGTNYKIVRIGPICETMYYEDGNDE